MNPIRIALLAFVIAVTKSTAALDISDTIILERYTLLDATMVQYDQGYLSRNGQFRAVTSSTYNLNGPIGVPAGELDPVSGRPIMSAQLFDAYHSGGVIPNWVRSRLSFHIGYADYVIVGVKGKTDPNPAPVITKQPESVRILTGELGFFSVEASPSTYSFVPVAIQECAAATRPRLVPTFDQR